MAKFTVAGYDPGGNGNHGIALLEFDASRITHVWTNTLDTAEEVIQCVVTVPRLEAIGVDTLTCWSTGPSGWRPADRWLRAQERYRDVRKSIVNPNYLQGAMGLNGAATIVAIREVLPDILVTETHPKILHWHFVGRPYQFYDASASSMCKALSRIIGCAAEVRTEHEWDAVISAFVALQGWLGGWTNDLHAKPVDVGRERLVSPCGKTAFFWPDDGEG